MVQFRKRLLKKFDERRANDNDIIFSNNVVYDDDPPRLFGNNAGWCV